MATIQLGNTKVASKLISYAEKRSEVSSGLNCPSEYAKAQFKATRELWGKTEGIQAHHVIQSFKPGEVTPEEANEMGLALAKEVAEKHEVAVYTHTDKEHIHNHIVINAVSYEDGMKYQSSKKDLYTIREASDRLCLERGLSVVKEPSAEQRYHRAEYGLAKRGEMSWKDEIREVIDHERQQSKSYEEFKKNVTDKHGIEVKERGKNISFKHPDMQKFVRGKTLGLAYERGTLEHDFAKERTRENGQERGESSSDEFRGVNRTSESDRGVSVNVSEGKHEQGNSHYKRTERNQKHESKRSGADKIDFSKIDKQLTDRKRGLQKAHQQQHSDIGKDGGEVGKGIKHEQGNDRQGAQRDKERDAERNKKSEPERSKQVERNRTNHQSHGLER
ncbi:relaxase/mobilization nuclease domain-containing protein [Halalkalibacter lacteus]|uniref:relaxase/mobilization nuclease domain-containing protein n=1 Tax=Halalkalibacter lacteus TaxID=3090663 RepID=UPI002FCAA1E2